MILARCRCAAASMKRTSGSSGRGRGAEFTVDAYPDRVFQGRVVQVRKAPETVQNVVTYAAIVSAPNPRETALPRHDRRAEDRHQRSRGRSDRSQPRAPFQTPAGSRRARRAVREPNQRDASGPKALEGRPTPVDDRNRSERRQSHRGDRRRLARRRARDRRRRQTEGPARPFVGMARISRMQAARPRDQSQQGLSLDRRRPSARSPMFRSRSPRANSSPFAAGRAPENRPCCICSACSRSPNSGRYELNGVEISRLGDFERAAARCALIGFVFQHAGAAAASERSGKCRSAARLCGRSREGTAPPRRSRARQGRTALRSDHLPAATVGRRAATRVDRARHLSTIRR